MKNIYVVTFLDKMDWGWAFNTKKEAEVAKGLFYGNDDEARVVELEVKNIVKELEDEQ